jgi:serine/threonine protein kinase
MQVLYSLKDNAWKICDFGFTSEGGSDENAQHISDRGRGTGGYRAPELICEAGSYNRKSDIWAFGCIVHELATKKKRFKNDWETLFWVNQEKNSSESMAVHETTLSKFRPRESSEFIVKSTIQGSGRMRPSAAAIVAVLENSFRGLALAIIADVGADSLENIQLGPLHWGSYWCSISVTLHGVQLIPFDVSRKLVFTYQIAFRHDLASHGNRLPLLRCLGCRGYVLQYLGTVSRKHVFRYQIGFSHEWAPPGYRPLSLRCLQCMSSLCYTISWDLAMFLIMNRYRLESKPSINPIDLIGKRMRPNMRLEQTDNDQPEFKMSERFYTNLYLAFFD